MRALLALTAALILYGSLYPFNFSGYTYTPERLAQLADFSIDSALTGNAIANVLLFLPWGIFTVGASRREDSTRWLMLSLLSLLGFAIAYLAQFAQVFLAGRIPSGIDVAWNLLGQLIGLAAGLALIDRLRVAFPIGPVPIPLLLVTGWLGYQWLPFVPTLDLVLLTDNLRVLLANRMPSPFWVFQNTLLWLICLQLVERYVPQLPRYWYPLGILGVLAIGALLMGSTVNIDDIAGAGCALVLWSLLGPRWYPGWQALLLAFAIIGASYLPLQWRETPGDFSWIPFSGALGSNVVLNVIATWKKLVLYGLLIWLAVEAGFRLRYATGLTALLLFISEWFQVYIRGATPEITDPLLALGLGVGMALHRLAAARSAALSLTASGLPRAADRWHDPGEAIASPGDGSGPRPGPRSSRNRWTALFLTLVLGSAVALALFQPEPAPARLRGELEWASKPADLIADLHTHTRTSDGSLTEAELVAAALDGGCNVLAITDHSDSGASGGERQQRAIAALRQAHPELFLFHGLELDIPSYGGREHMNVLLHPDQADEWLPRLRRTVDEAKDNGADPDRGFLNLIKRVRDGKHRALLIYNHPSRKVERVEESLEDLQRWRDLGARVDAIAGAPGHQRYEAIGAYPAAITTEDRWDPAAAVIGGVWDQYVASGNDLWAALASSDYHGSGGDAAPCAFSRIHISAPSRSYDGILEALDDGTFWADHGRILDQLSLAVELDGLPRALYPGESADVFTKDSVAMARVDFIRGPGSMGAPLAVEIISSCVDGSSRLVARRQLGAEESRAEVLIPVQATPAEDNSCIVRARVRLDNFGLEPDLMAYTNYVRINLRLGVLEGRVLDWRLQ